MAKTFLFKPKWYMGADIEIVVKTLLIGRSLNFPCGQSKFGDVRADLDKSVKPDIICDILKPKTYPKEKFDTVFCDPPFNFYVDNRIGWKWIYRIAALTNQRVIFKTPKIVLKLKRDLWKKHYIILEDNRIGLSLLQIFDRTNTTLI